MSIRMVILGILVVSVIIIGYLLWSRVPLLRISQTLVAESVPYEQDPPHAEYAVLVLGDSTAVGTGAALPHDSVAGRLGAEFPNISIENHAENGAVVRDVLRQIEHAKRDTYDLILIHMGANDVIRFKSVVQTAVSTRDVLDVARKKSEHVVFLTAGNIGAAPLFFPPLSTFYTSRALALRALNREHTEIEGVVYVDLYADPQDDPFVQQADLYHAKDGLHPSSVGYAHWYTKIRAVLDPLPFASTLGRDE